MNLSLFDPSKGWEPTEDDWATALKIQKEIKWANPGGDCGDASLHRSRNSNRS